MSFHLLPSDAKWQNDNSVSNCNICRVKFNGGFFKSGKHHCRKCGRIICSTCSNYKYMNHRICSDCNTAIKSNLYSKPVFNPTHHDNVTVIAKSQPLQNQPILISKGTNRKIDVTNKPFHNNYKRQMDTESTTNANKIQPSITATFVYTNERASSGSDTRNKTPKRVVPIPPPRPTPSKRSIIPPPPPARTIVLQNIQKEKIENENKGKHKKHKECRKQRKQKKHGKHCRSSHKLEQIVDDISNEIFLKLLSTFDELIENDSNRKKRKKKYKKKKKRTHKHRGHKVDTTQKTQVVKGETHKFDDEIETNVIITPDDHTDEMKKNVEGIPDTVHRTEEQVMSKHDHNMDDTNTDRLICGESMMAHSDRWMKLNADTFKIRPKDYYAKKKKGKKVASKPAMYEVVAVDAYKINEKLTFLNVINRYGIDVRSMIDIECNDALYLPYLMIVNVVLPLKGDHKGIQFTFYCTLSKESQEQLKQNNISESMKLLSSFCNCDDADDIRNDFKVTVRVNNLSKTKLPFLMRKLISRANGQSIAIKENVSYYLDPSNTFFIVDIDAFDLSKQILSMWNKACLCLDSIIYDIAFHIGAHDADYLPEQILLCTHMNKLSINDMISIDEMKMKSNEM